jgi:hypothetical protein
MVDHMCVSFSCIDMFELDKALEEMKNEGLVTISKEDIVWLTPEGLRQVKNGKA